MPTRPGFERILWKIAIVGYLIDIMVEAIKPGRNLTSLNLN